MIISTEGEIHRWFSKYMPGDEPPANVRFDVFDVDLGKDKKDMYPGLRNGLSSMLTAVGCTDLEATYCHPDSSNSSSLRDQNRSRPHFGIYPKAHSNPVALDTSTAPSASSDEVASSTCVSWARAELLIEVKYGPAIKSCSTKFPSLRAALYGSRTVDYVAEVFNRQHRLFIFMIAFVHDHAYFLRFDRAGVVTSKGFCYKKHPEIIGKFLHRFSRMTREERGHDPTVTLASAEEHTLFRNLCTTLPYSLESAVGKGLLEAADRKWPVYKVTIDSPFSPDGAVSVRREDPRSQRQFLVGKPTYFSQSLVGKGTRGYVAYDIARKDAVFIKDSWRPETSYDTRSEYDTYLLLTGTASSLDLLRIPTLLGGGDVVFNGNVQRTATPVHISSPPRVHFRLVMKEVCRKLETFRHSLELVVALSWACHTHYVAWTECDVLHRDISVGNILIYEQTPGSIGIGLLADWDLAKTKEEIENCGLTEMTRAGTWPFMSARLQHSGIDERHEVADDLESFVHVLNWCCLKHLRHCESDDVKALTSYMSLIYDGVNDGVFPAKGSAFKLTHVSQGYPFAYLGNIKQPLNQLLKELSYICREHYFHIQFPPRFIDHSETLPSTVNETASKPPPIDWLETLSRTVGEEEGLGMIAPEYDDLELSSAPLSPPYHPPSPTADPARSPLRTHEAMLHAFNRVVGSNVSFDEMKKWPLDKILGRDLILGVQKKVRSGSLLASSPYVSVSPGDVDSGSPDTPDA